VGQLVYQQLALQGLGDKVELLAHFSPQDKSKLHDSEYNAYHQVFETTKWWLSHAKL